MAVPFVLGDLVDATDNAIQKIYIKKRAEKEKEDYKLIANVRTGVKERIYKESNTSVLGLAGRITEQAAVVFESPIQGYDFTWTQTEFGLATAVSKQLWVFGIKFRGLESYVNDLRNSLIRKREQMITARLNNAQSSSYTENDVAGNFSVTITGGNGVALASSAQTREDAGTNNNNIVYDGTNYNISASYNALKSLERTAALVLDPKGNQLNLTPTDIFVRKGHGAKHRFLEVLGALKNGKLPETFSNDGAGVNYDYKVHELQYATSATAWSALDAAEKRDESGIQYLESQPEKMEGPNVVFKTSEMQYKETAMWDIGHNDYRGWFNAIPT